MTIEVCERLMDYRLVPEFLNGEAVGMIRAPKYHAQIKGEPGYWAAGDSIDSAVGNLVSSHPEKFGVKIKMLGKKAR